MTLREAKPEEAMEQLVALSAAWEEEDSCWGYHRNSPAYFEGKRVFLALEDGSVIGYLLGYGKTLEEGNSIYAAGAACFEVDELYVAPSHRSRGIGRALFAFAEDAVKDETDIIMLTTATKNYKAILHFYLDEVGMDFWSAHLFKKIK